MPNSRIDAISGDEDMLLDDKQLLNFANQDLSERLDARIEFMKDFSTCKHALVQVNAGGVQYVDFAILFLKAYPICVGRAADAVPTQALTLAGGIYNIAFPSRDWDNCELISLQWDGVVGSYSTINAYLRRLYSTPSGRTTLFSNCTSATTQLMHLDMTYAGRSFTQAQMYAMPATDIFKNFRDLFQLYDQERVKTRNASYATSDGGAWSEQSWPEMIGIRTEYIDNVGVFIPDFCSIDFNLSHDLGSDMLGLKVTRLPTLEHESNARIAVEWAAFIKFLSGSASTSGGAMGSAATGDGSGSAKGSGIAQGIINTAGYFVGFGQRMIENRRLIFPRIRAFGRQATPIPSYEHYKAGFQSFFGAGQTTRAGDQLVIKEARYANLTVIMIPEGLWQATVEQLRPYVGSR